jgi:hypothetical protein
MENLNSFLSQLNEEGEGEVAGVTRSSAGIKNQADWESIPTSIKQMFRDYKRAGGHDDFAEFLDDMVQFLQNKKYTGRHIAKLDMKQDPEGKISGRDSE